MCLNKEVGEKAQHLLIEHSDSRITKQTGGKGNLGNVKDIFQTSDLTQMESRRDQLIILDSTQNRNIPMSQANGPE